MLDVFERAVDDVTIQQMSHCHKQQSGDDVDPGRKVYLSNMRQDIIAMRHRLATHLLERRRVQVPVSRRS